MSKRKELERLVGELESGGISRRDFVRRAMALGIGVGSAGALLSACGGGDREGRAGDSAGQDAGELGPIEKELHIYNWSDYIAEDTVPNFEKEFGVKVTYDTYESNEEMVAKLQAGATGYDIVVPSSYWAKLQADGGLLRKLDKSKLPGMKNLDPGNEYMVDWLWGFTTVGINVDKVKAARRGETTTVG